MSVLPSTPYDISIVSETQTEIVEAFAAACQKHKTWSHLNLHGKACVIMEELGELVQAINDFHDYVQPDMERKTLHDMIAAMRLEALQVAASAFRMVIELRLLK